MKLNKFDFICNTVDNGVVIIDKDLKIYFWNHWLETRTNLKSNEVENRYLNDLFPNIKEKTLKRKIKAALILNSPTFFHPEVNNYLIEIELNKVTNKVFNNMQQGVTITPYDKKNDLVVLYIYDNTLLFETNQELIETKNRLEESLEEINLLLNTTMEAIFVFENEKCINANETALKLFKYTCLESLSNIKITNLVNKNHHHYLETSSESPNEATMTRSDNTEFPALIKLNNKKLRNKELKILTIVDLTEIKKKDKLLVEQTKMAALGEMIGNIAHQWRQPLSTISTAASGIKMHKELNILTDKLFNDALSAIIKSSKHLSQTIDDFRNFLRDDKHKINFNVIDNIKKNLSIIEGMLKNDSIKIEITGNESINVTNYENEFTQAFLNIINNSKDAFVENNINFDERYIFIDVQSNKKNISIKIADNAGGIPKNIINKIFEPYFTTKHKNLGTGLGLYMTHQIVEMSMEGSIKVYNNYITVNDKNFKGVVFEITLPFG